MKTRRSLWQRVGLVILTGLLVLGLHTLATAQSVDPPQIEESPNPIETPVPPQPEVGWVFLGQRELNQTVLQEVEYFGDCPGEEVATVEARFTSAQTPPADKRRVMIRNITRGMDSDPYPYTDREYEEGGLSEATNMRFGLEHSGRYFHVMPGENTFEYEIRVSRRGAVLESGTFTAYIGRELQRVQRDATYGEDRVCANPNVALDVCADIRDRHKWSCPNGRIIESEVFPSDPRITTAIYNDTRNTLEVAINGRMHRIYPGSYLEFEDYNPSVTYETGSGRTSRSLTAGTRYRFYLRDNQLRIDEYRR